MKVTVLGQREVNFPDKETGEYISGTSIYVCYPDEGVKGCTVNKIFIKSGSPVIIPEFDFGCDYDFQYDGFGRRTRLVSISKV